MDSDSEDRDSQGSSDQEPRSSLDIALEILNQNDDADMHEGSDVDEESVQASQPQSGEGRAIRSPSPTDDIRNQQDDDDHTCPTYLRNGFAQIPPILRNEDLHHDFCLPLDVFEENVQLLAPSMDSGITMDAVSKTMWLIPRSDIRHYLQPYEGGYMYFVSQSNGMTLSKEAETALYFFHMLEYFIQQRGITNFVVQTDQGLSYEYSKDNPKVVSSISETMLDINAPDHMDTDERAREFDASDVFYERIRQSTCDLREERKPFTVKLAVTGAFFEVDGKVHQKLFYLVIVTPAKNFNLLDYIQYIFLNLPRNPQKADLWRELCACWKHLMMYEANHNCNLSGDPMAYKTNPGGVMGFFTLTSMLNIPYRIYNIVHKEFPSAKNLKILGCPELNFTSGGVDDNYASYYHKTVNVQTSVYEELQTFCKASQTSASGKDQESMRFKLDSAGAWPLKGILKEDAFSSKYKYQRFGHFKWPIVLDFNFMKYMGENITQEVFVMNMGVPFPLVVSHMMRKFLTYDSRSECGAHVRDEDFLKSTEEATPLKVYVKYYGPEPNTEDLRDTKLLQWFTAFKLHLTKARKSGTMTVDDACEQLKMHLFNCMRQHENIARTDGYSSKFFKQCMFMMDNLHKTELHDVDLKDYFKQLSTSKLPPKLRFHSYIKHSYFLMHNVSELNKDMRLNCLNLELYLETMLSSLHWHVGSHSHSFIPFFQSVMIASGAGHYDMAIEKDVMQMDWRKPNSSGAGMTQAALNRYFEDLGKLFMILEHENKLVWQTWSRNTGGGLESETCVILLDNEIVSTPSVENKYVPFTFTENRKKVTPYEIFILCGVPRDKSSLFSKISSTADPKKTGERLRYEKFVIWFVHFTMIASNEPPPAGDVPQTLYVVMHCCEPGCPSYKKLVGVDTSFFGDDTEFGEGRPEMRHDTKTKNTLMMCIHFMHVFARTYVAKPHNAGLLPYDINFVSNCHLDWIGFALKHVYCLFSPRVLTNFGRIKQGYESRHIAWSLWIRSIVAFANSEKDLRQAGINATMDCAFDPLPIVEIASVLHSELRRSLHAGLFAVLGCFIQMFNVPVIPPEDLCEFFKSPAVSYLRGVEYKGKRWPVMSVSHGDELDMCTEKADAESTSDVQVGDYGTECSCSVERADVEGEIERIDLNLESEMNDEFCVQESPAERWADVVADLRSRTVVKEAKPEVVVTIKEPVTPPCDTAHMIDELVEKSKDLHGKYVQLKDVLDRLELIFNQAIGRLDDQVSVSVTHQKRHSNAIQEIRGVVQALVAEVGEEAVNSRMLSLHSQSSSRQFEVFNREMGNGGGDRPGQYKGSGEYTHRPAYSHRGSNGGHEYGGPGYVDNSDYSRRRGRGGGRRQF